MITYGGERVYPDGDGVPTLNTVGVMLGRICRFNGGCREWYPVLGHVLVVAQILPPDAALAGLIHDAPEVCCADVPTPWKTQVARNREHRLLERMYDGWGLKWPIPDRVQNKVDWADAAVLAAEAHVLGHPRASEFWANPDPEIMEITGAMLDMAPNFLRADVAGPMFEEAFSHYRDDLDEFNTNKREARNAARIERERERSDATGAGVGRKAS
jgi:hypothetical protein